MSKNLQNFVVRGADRKFEEMNHMRLLHNRRLNYKSRAISWPQTNSHQVLLAQRDPNMCQFCLSGGSRGPDYWLLITNPHSLLLDTTSQKKNQNKIQISKPKFVVKTSIFLTFLNLKITISDEIRIFYILIIAMK